MTRRRLLKVCWMSLLILALLSVVLLFVTHRTPASNAASTASPARWRVVNSPNPGTTQNSFTSVAALSATDAWAVGSQQDAGPIQTLIEYWNGATWKVVKGPNPGSTDHFLNGVAAISSSNIWAVGKSYDVHTGTSRTLIEHWDGSQWSVISGPEQGHWSELYSVAALSATDVWAVGYTQSGGPRVQRTLIEHWNGTTWSIVASPHQVSTTNVLYGITALPTGDLWAVGSYESRTTLISQTLIEHYNGRSWSIIASPNINAMDNALSGVTAVSSHDIWAVGGAFNLSSNSFQTLIEHWNGATWTIVASPTLSNQSTLQEVTATSAQEVWAVGSTGVGKTLVEHWDGSTWSIVASPSPGAAMNSLDSVTRVPKTGQMWAVGSDGTNGTNANTLTELYG